jgi:hypothetical protein
MITYSYKGWARKCHNSKTTYPPSQKERKKGRKEEDRNTSACGQIFIVRNKETQMTTFLKQ